MEEIKRIKQLLLYAGFIDAQERIKREPYFKDLLRMFPGLGDPKMHIIDHYKLKNGVGIIMGMDAESPEIRIKFVFPIYQTPTKRNPHVSCHIDISEFQKVRTTNDFWEFIGDLFRQHVTPWWLEQIK